MENLSVTDILRAEQNVINNYSNNKFLEVNAIPEILNNKFGIIVICDEYYSKGINLLLRALNNCKYKENIQLIISGCVKNKTCIDKYCKIHKINKPYIREFEKNTLNNIIKCCDLYIDPLHFRSNTNTCINTILSGLVPVIVDSEKNKSKDYAFGDMNVFKKDSKTDLSNKISYWYERKYNLN